jgi:hypothetical protein
MYMLDFVEGKHERHFAWDRSSPRANAHAHAVVHLVVAAGRAQARQLDDLLQRKILRPFPQIRAFVIDDEQGGAMNRIGAGAGPARQSRHDVAAAAFLLTARGERDIPQAEPRHSRGRKTEQRLFRFRQR